MDQYPIQRGRGNRNTPMVTSCYGNQEKPQPNWELALAHMSLRTTQSVVGQRRSQLIQNKSLLSGCTKLYLNKMYYQIQYIHSYIGRILELDLCSTFVLPFQMENTIKQSESERERGLESLRRLHEEYKPLKRDIDKMRGSLGLEKTANLDEESSLAE